MRHFEIRTFENEAKQVIFSRTAHTGNLFIDTATKPIFFVNVPVAIDTPRGQIQIMAEIIIDAETSEDAFDAAPVQVPAKYEAAKKVAVDAFVAQQRAASLRMGHPG